MMRNEVKAILVFQVNHLGDFICSLPMLASLRQLFPDAYIHLVTSPEGKELLEHSELVDMVTSVSFEEYRRIKPKQAFRLLRALSGKKFDFSLCGEDECSVSAIISFLLNIKSRFGFLGVAKASVLYSHTLIFDPNKHIIENRYALLEAAKNVFAADQRLPSIARRGIVFSEDEENDFKKKFSEYIDKDFIVIHTGSRAAHKIWPIKKFFELIAIISLEKKDMRVLLLADTFPAKVDTTAIVLPPLSLREVAWLLRKAVCFVGANSGPMNLAVATGTPSVVINGPSPNYWRPYDFLDSRNKVVEVDLACRPCERMEYKVQKCQRNLLMPECLGKISSRDVYTALSTLL